VLNLTGLEARGKISPDLKSITKVNQGA